MTDKEFIDICKSAKSMADAQRITGLQFTTFKVKATKLGCYKPKSYPDRYKDIIPGKEKLLAILGRKESYISAI